jgi:hypothetical protein
MKRELVSIVASVAALFGIASGAYAGEGRIAGAAAFTTDADGNVTGVAVAAAVGKGDANAFAHQTSANINVVGALGSDGEVFQIESDGIVTQQYGSQGDLLGSGSTVNCPSCIITIGSGTGSEVLRSP